MRRPGRNPTLDRPDQGCNCRSCPRCYHILGCLEDGNKRQHVDALKTLGNTQPLTCQQPSIISIVLHTNLNRAINRTQRALRSEHPTLVVSPGGIRQRMVERGLPAIDLIRRRVLNYIGVVVSQLPRYKSPRLNKGCPPGQDVRLTAILPTTSLTYWRGSHRDGWVLKDTKNLSISGWVTRLEPTRAHVERPQPTGDVCPCCWAEGVFVLDHGHENQAWELDKQPNEDADETPEPSAEPRPPFPFRPD